MECFSDKMLQILSTSYFVILLILSSEVHSIKKEEIEEQKVIAFFSSKTIQVHHIIQTPIKTIIPFLGIVGLSRFWFYYRGDLYNMQPGTIFMYNLFFSTTFALIQSIKLLANRIITTIFLYIFAEKFEEIDVAATNALMRQKRSLTGSFEEGSFMADVLIPAGDQLFQTKGIVKDFLLTILNIVSTWIFWGMC